MERPDQIVVPMKNTLNYTASTVNKNDIILSWRNVSFSVPGPKKTRKVLLENMNGYVKSGEVVAIMGGSGAGKSSLLNVLAGRVASNTITTGDIHVNGKERKSGAWRKLCAYVEQEDIMYTNLTVEETFNYSARLRLPRSMSKQEKENIVEQTIMDLGLNGCRKTFIGDSYNRGISGGEKKRVSIGVELITQPKVLFMDEPTSGLDSFNAFNVMETIKDLARKRRKVVLVTIHQPRTDILDLFDRVILLSAGKMIWNGTIQDGLAHFESLGYPLPPRTNPSDFFLDTVTPDLRTPERKEESSRRIELFANAFERISHNSLYEGPHGEDAFNGLSSKWPSSWIMEFLILLGRNLKDDFRNKAIIALSLGQAIFIMLVAGFIFFKISNDQGGIQNRVGFLFFICVNQSFGTIMPNLVIFPLQREIVKRERAAASYRASSAYFAKVLSTVPLITLACLVLTTPIYWMVGLQPDAGRFLLFVLIVLVHTHASNALGFLIGSGAPNVRIGLIAGPLVIIFFLLFAGQLLNLDQIPQVLKWIQWISIIAYTNKALNQNELRGLKFTCDSPAGGCITTGEQVLENFKMTNPAIWPCIIINAGLAAAFLIIGLGLFSFTSGPQIKLETVKNNEKQQKSTL